MIIGFLIQFILNTLAFFFNFLFFPFRAIAPSFVVFDNFVTDIATVMANLFNSTFNFFAYFSHISSVRILFFSAVFYIFTFPIIYSSFALGKFVMDFIIKLPQFIASFKGLFK